MTPGPSKHTECGRLPDKLHRWVILVPFRLSDQEAANVMEEGVTQILDLEHFDRGIFAPVVGCFTCELVYALGRGKPCPGEPDGHHPDGDPYWHAKPDGW